MLGRIRIIIIAALLLQLPHAAAAQGAEVFPVLDSQVATRNFSGATITTTTSLRAGGNWEPGHRAYLQVDIETSLSGTGSAAMPRAVVINGFVSIALPPGLEPDGKPRLMYYEPAKDRYEFAYSGGYPQLPRFSGLSPAIEDTTSSDPERILDGLAQIVGVLDPAVEVSGPSDPRLTRADASYAVTGAAWLIPCNVLFRELVGLFHPETGLAQTARLRINLPLKATAELTNPRVVVYVGGLSSAVDQGMLLPEQIPATAIPLVPLDEPESAEETPPQDGGAPAAEQTAQSDGAAGPDSGEKAPAPADARDEAAPVATAEGEAPADGEQPKPKPEPVPVLVYSHEWIRWQAEVLLPLAPEAAPALFHDGEPAAEDVTAITPAILEPEDAGSSPPPGRFAQPESDREPQLAPDNEAVDERQPELAGDAETATEPADESFTATPQDTPGVRQVEPGTLPEVEQSYSVALKPLTGSGAGVDPSRPFRDSTTVQPPADTGGELPATINPDAAGGMTAGTYVPPTDLGQMVLIPEGYFLMGTGGSSSGGDADEMPQTQVFLPAYYIDKYPVTNRQFHNFVISAGHKPEGNWMKYYYEGTADLPVRGVTFNDAEAYAKWAGKRLPTEAEWEKAARGEDGRTYPWGEEWTASLLPRGEVLADILQAEGTESPYGVMGMSGLVWQWTSSAYSNYPFDPEARGEKRVLRGGCFSNGRNILRCANRYAESPNVALNTFGLRCVKDAP